MKPGITQLCLSRIDLEADLQHAKATGYEAIELVFSDAGQPSIDASAGELADVKAACERYDLELCSILPTRQDSGSLLSPVTAERDKRITIVQRGLEIAEALGAGSSG